MSKPKSDDQIRQAVRDTYGQIATQGASCCGSSRPPCCGDEPAAAGAGVASSQLGYSQDELAGLPEGADMTLGCGNPQAIADLREGETVLDLGSGAGIDVFLAARAVGPRGRAIGVDMTPEMVAKGRQLAAEQGYDNVDIRLGEIEHLPLADASVDAIISNCVINLSPDKPSVLAEAFRVLRPGGRLAVTDIVATAPLPEDVRNDLAAHAGCIAGAATVAELEAMLAQAGFEGSRIEISQASRQIIRDWLGDGNLHEYIASATIQAVKPGA